jgi:hypothetical protein
MKYHKNNPDLNLLTEFQGPRHKVFLIARNFRLTCTDNWGRCCLKILQSENSFQVAWKTDKGG